MAANVNPVVYHCPTNHNNHSNKNILRYKRLQRDRNKHKNYVHDMKTVRTALRSYKYMPNAI
jgi:hypothetical protein